MIELVEGSVGSYLSSPTTFRHYVASVCPCDSASSPTATTALIHLMHHNINATPPSHNEPHHKDEVVEVAGWGWCEWSGSMNDNDVIKGVWLRKVQTPTCIQWHSLLVLDSVLFWRWWKAIWGAMRWEAKKQLVTCILYEKYKGFFY